MRRPRRESTLICGAALLLLLAGCGAGASISARPVPTSDPAGAVTRFFAEVTAGRYDTLSDYVCAAKKDEIGGKFTADAQLGPSVGGTMSNAEFAAVWKMGMRNLAVSEVSRSADSAVTHVSGEGTLDIDTDKLISIINSNRVSVGGAPMSDEEKKEFVEFLSLAEKPTQIDGDMTLSLENGVWLVCSLPA